MSSVAGLGFDEATQVRPTFRLLFACRRTKERKKELKLMTSRLFGYEQKELTTFLENEQAKAKLQQSIHTFTSMCWDK